MLTMVGQVVRMTDEHTPKRILNWGVEDERKKRKTLRMLDGYCEKA